MAGGAETKIQAGKIIFLVLDRAVFLRFNFCPFAQQGYMVLFLIFSGALLGITFYFCVLLGHLFSEKEQFKIYREKLNNTNDNN